MLVNIFNLKGILTLISLLFLSCWALTPSPPQWPFSFLASPPHVLVFFCPLCGHPCPSVPLCPPSALSLFCTFSRILILIYESGTLAFLFPWPQDFVTCCSIFCCPSRSESLISPSHPPCWSTFYDLSFCIHQSSGSAIWSSFTQEHHPHAHTWCQLCFTINYLNIYATCQVHLTDFPLWTQFTVSWTDLLMFLLYQSGLSPRVPLSFCC